MTPQPGPPDRRRPRRAEARGTALAAAMAVILVLSLPANGRAASASVRFVAMASATSKRAQVTAITVRFGAPTVAHALLAATVATGASCDSAIGGLTDDGGNTWERATGTCLPDAFPNLEMWFAPNASPATAVTASWALPAHAMIDVFEFTGVALVAPLDAVGSSSGHDGKAGTSSEATPSAPGDLAVGALCGDVIQPVTVTSTEFHNAPQLGAGRALTMRSGGAGLPSNSPVSYDGTWPSPMDWVGVIALFRAA